MILADEPVASLDPVLAHSIMQYLEILNQEDKMTIICSSALPGFGAAVLNPGDWSTRWRNCLSGQSYRYPGHDG